MTATEVLVALNPPPRRVFPASAGTTTRCASASSPTSRWAVGTRVKKEGEGIVGEDIELVAQRAPPTTCRPTNGCSGTR